MADKVLVRFIHTGDGDLHGRIIKEYSSLETDSIVVTNRRSISGMHARQVPVMRKRRQTGKIGRVVFLYGYSKKNKDQWNRDLPANRSYWVCEIEREAKDYMDSKGQTGFLVRLLREITEF